MLIGTRRIKKIVKAKVCIYVSLSEINEIGSKVINIFKRRNIVAMN